jgi:hypothetical protein
MNTFIYNFTNSDAATTEFRAQIQEITSGRTIDNISLHRAVTRCKCNQIGTPVSIKDLKDIVKSMISGHFNRDAATVFWTSERQFCSKDVSTKGHSSAMWELVAYVRKLCKVLKNLHNV